MKIKRNILNDILNRNHYKNNEYKLIVIKILIRLKLINFFDLLYVTSKIKKMSFFCNINNKCYVTSRSRGIFSKIKLSRIKLKEFINNGLLTGFNKYSW